MTNINYFYIGAGIVAAIAFVFFFKRFKEALNFMFGGTFDKVELGGLIFTILLFRMIDKEGNRVHEWQIYNEVYIFIVAGAALTGLGLTTVFEHLKELKNIGSNTSTKETQIIKKEVTNNSEDSK